jgi:hypothetical protein
MKLVHCFSLVQLGLSVGCEVLDKALSAGAMISSPARAVPLDIYRGQRRQGSMVDNQQGERDLGSDYNISSL